MYSFFVLGLVPGTNIQITFQIWLDSLLLLAICLLAASLYRLNRVTNSWLIMRIAPLSADLVHQRLAHVPLQRRHYPTDQTVLFTLLQPALAIGRKAVALPAGIAALL